MSLSSIVNVSARRTATLKSNHSLATRISSHLQSNRQIHVEAVPTELPYSGPIASTSRLSKQNAGRPSGTTKNMLRVISSLHPDKIKRSDYVDFSSVFKASIAIRGGAPRNKAIELVYKTEGEQRHHWPDNARGFLYYHDDPMTPLRGEVRFFVQIDGDSEGGRDLTLPSDRLWSITLLQILTVPKYQPFKQLLIADGLIAKSFVTRMRKEVVQFGSINRFGQRHHLYSIEDEFNADFEQSGVNLTVCTPRGIRSLRIRNFLRDIRPHINDYPYSGSAVFRFEPSTLSEDVGKRIMHLRIIRIINRVKVKSDVYDGYIPLPMAGDRLRGSRGKVLEWDLDSVSNARPARHALELLWPKQRIAGDCSGAPASRVL